jgi:hypothetical protein
MVDLSFVLFVRAPKPCTPKRDLEALPMVPKIVRNAYRSPGLNANKIAQNTFITSRIG